jgi:hypothetical protein
MCWWLHSYLREILSLHLDKWHPKAGPYISSLCGTPSSKFSSSCSVLGNKPGPGLYAPWSISFLWVTFQHCTPLPNTSYPTSSGRQIPHGALASIALKSAWTFMNDPNSRRADWWEVSVTGQQALFSHDRIMWSEVIRTFLTYWFGVVTDSLLGPMN